MELRCGALAGRVLLGMLVALSGLATGCSSPEAPTGALVALGGGGQEVPADGSAVTIDWDARDVRADDGSPMVAFLAYEDIELVAEAVAPADGVLTISVGTFRSLPPVARVPLATDTPIPEDDLLSAHGTVDNRGVSGREWVRRSLVNAASGGYPTQYPNFVFRLVLTWAPEAAQDGDSLRLQTIAVRAHARPIEDLYAPEDHLDTGYAAF